MSESDLLTVPQAAERTGFSIRTVKSWIASGELVSVKIGYARRIESAKLEAFIADRREGGDGA